MCDLQICRICLNTDVKGYKLEKHSLRNYYEYLTRQKLNTRDCLPQWVCYECGMMLHKYHKFKEKCLQGEHVLKQISLRGKVTYESVAVINRYSEKLISSIGIAVVSKKVKVTSLKFKNELCCKVTEKKLCDKTRPVERVDIKTDMNINELSINDHVTSGASNAKTNLDVNNICIISNDAELEKIESNLEHNDFITITSNDTVKVETSENSNKHLYNISDRKDIERDNNKEYKRKNTNEIDSINYDSDIDFEIMEDVNTHNVSSDDETLAGIMKKRAKVKHKPTNDAMEPKIKKTKSETKNVELKNTKPNKQILNPQFWKKISLNEEEAVREFRRKELDNEYYLKAKYKCQNCFKGFSKNEMLVRHVKIYHDESSGQAECRFCRMRFRHKHQLVTHMQEHLIIHHCLRCNLQFSRLKAALVHQEYHKGIKWTCKHCGKEFNHQSTYYSHLRMSHRSSHVCVACGAPFVSEQGLLQHTKFKHFDNLKELEEEIRKRRKATDKADTSSEQDVTQAQATPATDITQNTEEIYCGKCDIKFKSRRAFNRHFLRSNNHDEHDGSRMRPNIPTACKYCNKGFPSREACRKHHVAEHGQLPLALPRDICEICGASVQRGWIPYHMKSHTGERDYLCPAPACGRRFTLKANMNRHYNVKHLGIVYPKYIRKTPGRRKKKTEDILDYDESPFARKKK